MERFLDYFVPEKYQLSLVIDKIAKVMVGEVKIAGEVKGEVVKFHAVGLKVQEVVVDGEAVEFDYADDVLSVKGLPKKAVEFTIIYNGALNENMEGAYLSTYEYEGQTEVIVATQFESHYAREAFPCVDEPAAKAVFELSLTIPEGSDDLVLANTPVLEKKGNTTVFEPTPRMSTYLLAWVIGRFHEHTVTNGHGVEITTYAALNQDINSVDFANEVAARSLEFYDDNFGIPYPLKKLDQVALPDFEAGAMENWGLVTYRESMLLAGESATIDTRKSVALTVAHELSHQWFGDLVTMEWWDDLWLNESFASVMEYYAVDEIYPDFQIFENFFTGEVISALRRDALSGVQSVHQEVANPAEIAVLFDPAIVYAKGARLMLMLIRSMGWQEFCRGIHDYFEKFQYHNTVGDDLWAALKPYAEFDVHDLLHAFIDKPGFPVLESDDEFAHYTQKRFLLDGPMKKSEWPIPEVCEDLSGHYILNLTEEEFEDRLARFEELSLEEKLRLLIDRDLVSKTELASSASLLPLLMKFRKEDSAAVWSVMATIVNGLKIFFQYKTPEEKNFKKFVGDLVKDKLAEIGVKAGKKDDSNRIHLRDILISLDFYAENEETLKSLAKMYNKDYAKLDPELKDGILVAKLHEEPTMFDTYLEQYQKLADPELKDDLLAAMTDSREEENVRKALELLDRPTVVKPQDQLYLFVDLYRNPVARERVFEWLRTHWDYVVNMSGDKSLDSYPRYLAGMMKTGKELDDFKEFFWPKRDNPALTRAVEIGVKQLESRLKLIEEDRKAVYDYLKQ